MSRTEQIMEFIKSNPRSTNRQIAEGIGYESARVATITRIQTEKGRLHRQAIAKTTSGMPIYAYTYVGSETRASQKRDAKSNMKTYENVRVVGFDSMFDQIGQAIAQQIVARIKTHVVNELTSIVPETLSLPEIVPQMPQAVSAAMPTVSEIIARAQQPDPPKARKLRALVIGLLPTQAGVLSTEFHDAVDLEFWNDRTGNSMLQLKQLAKGADMVFVHTAHVSHKVSEALKSVGAEFKNVTGGVTSMREALLNYYANNGTVN